MTRIGRITQILALMALSIVVPQAWADAGLPAPSLDISFLFQNLDQFPEHDFYLKQEWRHPGAKNSQVTLHKIEKGTPTHVGGTVRRFKNVYLVAVPRGQALQVPEKLEADWVTNAPPGGMQSAALRGGEGNPLESFNGYDLTYRVRIADGKLEADWVEANLNEWWSNARLIAIVIGAACVLIPIAIVTLTVLGVVRLFKRPAAASDTV